MPLKNKLGHGILINTLAGSVGLTGILSGCTSEEMDNFSNFMLGSGLAFDAAAIKQSNLGNYQRASSLSAMGDAARFITSNQNRINAAQAGRSEINIYNTPSRYESLNSEGMVKKSFVLPEKQVSGLISTKNYGIVIMGTCNYIEDSNNNGIIDYPEEFFSNNRPGMKDKFRVDERITLILGSSGDLFGGLTMNVFDENGFVVDEFISGDQLWGLRRDYNFGDEGIQLDSGIYRAIFNSEKGLIGSWTFEVNDEK